MNESSELNELRQLVILFNNSTMSLMFKFAIWESMNDRQLIDVQNRNHTGNVFEYIRNSLLINCFLDIANLGKDVDRHFKLLSLEEIKRLLNNPKIRNELLTQLENKELIISYISSPPPKEYQDTMASERRTELISFFKSSLKSFDKKLKDSKFNHRLNVMWAIRSKIAAHTELAIEDDQLKSIDISTYGLKWDDISLLIKDLCEINKLLFAIVENSDLTCGSFESDMGFAISNFWKPYIS